MKQRVLLVEDDELQLGHYAALLEAAFRKDETEVEILTAATGEKAVEIFRTTPDLNVVLLDWHLPEGDGRRWVRELKRVWKVCHIIVITVDETVEKAFGAIGADDFLNKSAFHNEARARVAKAFELVRRTLAARREIAGEFPAIVAEDPKVIAILEKADLYALEDPERAICIVGHTGTGKELLARRIHYHPGSRRTGPFVPVNCGSFFGDIGFTEFLGIEEKVATGVAKREGKFAEANGGTLFLDEIDKLKEDWQQALLRVLSGQKIHRYGERGDGFKPDVRLVVAGLNIDSLSAEFRIRVTGFRLPPLPSLKERKDLGAIARGLIATFNAEDNQGNYPTVLPDETVVFLESVDYLWPENIRELGHVLARAKAHAVRGVIDKNALLVGSPELGKASVPPPPATSRVERLSFEECENRYVAALIANAIKRCGTQYSAAEELGLQPTTLSEKMKILRRKGYLTKGKEAVHPWVPPE